MTSHPELKKSASLGHFFKKAPKEDSEPSVEESTEKDVSLAAFFGPFMKNYAATLSSTKGNPAKIPYPPRFYIPVSSLQHAISSKMKHIGILETANHQPDPKSRFFGVLKYFFSTLNLTKFPYKPIIAMEGETAHNFVSSGSSQTYSIGEEIVHHPPHSAFHICNLDNGFTYDGNIVLEPTFSKGSVRVRLEGFNRIVLKDPKGSYEEAYTFGNPDLLVRMLRMLTECVGEVLIECATTGYSAVITFKEKPLFGGTKNAIDGVVSFNNTEIAHLDGVWDDIIFITDLNTKARNEFLDRKHQKIDRVETPPLETLPETAGDRVWGPFIDLLKRDNLTEAQNWKLARNATERGERALRKANNVQPAHFVKNSSGWWEIKNPAVSLSLMTSGKSAA